ncbi:hypothetical protein KDA14_05540, partial [Candidatus Saccharibacteria bacterium]|nr:hypothetical protein [Candidatus Saccharibacteria bacterium]
TLSSLASMNAKWDTLVQMKIGTYRQKRRPIVSDKTRPSQKKYIAYYTWSGFDKTLFQELVSPPFNMDFQKFFYDVCNRKWSIVGLLRPSAQKLRMLNFSFVPFKQTMRNTTGAAFDIISNLSYHEQIKHIMQFGISIYELVEFAKSDPRLADLLTVRYGIVCE